MTKTSEGYCEENNKSIIRHICLQYDYLYATQEENCFIYPSNIFSYLKWFTVVMLRSNGLFPLKRKGIIKCLLADKYRTELIFSRQICIFFYLRL